METLGKMIGLVIHSFGITNDAGDKATLQVKIDFTSCSNAEIKGWLASNRTIAGQTSWRKLTLDELNELNGRTFNAVTIGHKVESRAKMIEAYVKSFMDFAEASGFLVDGEPMTEEQAREFAINKVDNPS